MLVTISPGSPHRQCTKVGTPAHRNTAFENYNSSYYIYLMSVRTQHGNEPTLYYITFTCYNWLYLFSITNGYDLIYKWFDYLKDSAQIKVTAYEIINRLKQLNENKILQQLEQGLSEREKKKGQLHKVFKDSFDAKPIYTRSFLLQKFSTHILIQ